MAHHRRKRNKRKVRCAMCTPFRNGNSFLPFKVYRANDDFKRQKDDL